MPRKLKDRLTFANVVSLMALFFALGGSAFAAVIVTSNDDVAPDTIAGHKPGPGKHSNLILGSVTNEDLAPETVKTGRITDGTVGLRDLATDSVDETKVKDDSLGLADLGADSVSASKLVGTAFYGVGTKTANDPVGGPATDVPMTDLNATFHVIGRCNQSTAGVVTARVIIKSALTNMSVDSTAPGGANDLPSVPPGSEATLASLGPTSGPHVAVGAFGLMSTRVPDGTPIHPFVGTVSVSTHVQNHDCEFGLVAHG